MSFPAELFFGFLNKLPADLLFRGWEFFLPVCAFTKFSIIISSLAFLRLKSADNKISFLVKDDFLYEKSISFFGIFLSSFFELIS